MDPVFGDYANHDLAVPPGHLRRHRRHRRVLDRRGRPAPRPDRTKGIGEIGIVGTAAAVANAVSNATGVRLRSLPLHLEDLLALRRA